MASIVKSKKFVAVAYFLCAFSAASGAMLAIILIIFTVCVILMAWMYTKRLHWAYGPFIFGGFIGGTICGSIVKVLLVILFDS